MYVYIYIYIYIYIHTYILNICGASYYALGLSETATVRRVLVLGTAEWSTSVRASNSTSKRAERSETWRILKRAGRWRPTGSRCCTPQPLQPPRATSEWPCDASPLECNRVYQGTFPVPPGTVKSHHDYRELWIHTFSQDSGKKSGSFHLPPRDFDSRFWRTMVSRLFSAVRKSMSVLQALERSSKGRGLADSASQPFEHFSKDHDLGDARVGFSSTLTLLKLTLIRCMHVFRSLPNETSALDPIPPSAAELNNNNNHNT